MGLIVEHSDQSRPQVYQFQVQDEGALALTFSCVAKSVQDAFAVAHKAGFHSVLLMEARDLTAEESASDATRRVLTHPLLGPEWMPIVEAVELITSELRAGKFWILNTHAALHGYDPYASPYVQAMREDDGSLHVEIGGRSQNLGSAGIGQSALLELLGWNAPVDDDPENMDGHLPNSFRVFEAGWSARAISEFFLESLVVVFGLTTDDFFSVGGDFTTKVSRMIPGLYRLTGKETFSLKPGPDSEDEYDPDFDESAMVPEGYLGEAPAPGWETSEAAEPEQAEPDVAEAPTLKPRNFRGEHLEDEDFSGASLVGANFAKCKLTNVTFANADLSGADFSDAYFEYVSFENANLTGAIFVGSYGDYGLSFSFADLSRADMTNAGFETAWFIEATMIETRLLDSRLRNCDFHGAALTRVNLNGASLTRCDFAGVSAEAIRVDGARFIDGYANVSEFADTDFSSAHLYECDFSSSTFDRSTFDGMNLSGNDFSGSRFWAASCIGTDFREAFGETYVGLRFADANLRGAVFSGEKIHNSDFLRADLGGASFAGSNLFEVDFSGAQLEGADFREADIEDCTFDGAEPDTRVTENADQLQDAKRLIPALEQIRQIASTVNRPELQEFVTWHHYRLMNSDGWKEAAQAVKALMSTEVFDLITRTRLGKTYGDGPRNSRHWAADALTVRHRIASGELKQAHYDLLTESWAVSYGLAHPNDQKPVVTLWGPEYEFGAESRNLRYMLAYVRYFNNGLWGELGQRTSPQDHLFRAALDRMNQSLSGREQMAQDLSQLVVAVARSLTQKATGMGIIEVLGRVTTAVLVRDKISEEDFDLLTTDWRMEGGPLEAPQIRSPLPYQAIDFTAWPP